MRAFFLAGAILAFLPSCILIPLPKQGLLWGRGAVRQGDIRVLEVGETSREEVLRRLGPPEIALENGRILVYDWGVVAGIGAVLGTVAPISADCCLVLEFGGDSRLVRFNTPAGNGWSDAVTEARKVIRKRYPMEGPWPRTWVVEADPLPELWTGLGRVAGRGRGIRAHGGVS